MVNKIEKIQMNGKLYDVSKMTPATLAQFVEDICRASIERTKHVLDKYGVN